MIIVRHFRGYQGIRRRSMLRPVIQTFKKVLIFADASFAAGFTSEQIAIGVDSVAAGQTGPTDTQVPTGSRLKYFEIQFAAANIASSTCFINCTIQLIQSQQSALDPDLVGGNTRRNNVFHMDLFSVGINQNSTHKFKFKVPKGFQRVKEGTAWELVWRNTSTINRKLQIIYKFER